nr:1-aminocyclopropane-1-carboxylate oxidase 5-like [Tanacetum cinerariifolium]
MPVFQAENPPLSLELGVPISSGNKGPTRYKVNIKAFSPLPKAGTLALKQKLVSVVKSRSNKNQRRGRKAKRKIKEQKTMAKREQKTMAQIANGCEEWGLFELVNHGIREELLERVKKVSIYKTEREEEFFKNLTSVKLLKELLYKKSNEKLENIDWETIMNGRLRPWDIFIRLNMHMVVCYTKISLHGEATFILTLNQYLAWTIF